MMNKKLTEADRETLAAHVQTLLSGDLDVIAYEHLGVEQIPSDSQYAKWQHTGAKAFLMVILPTGKSCPVLGHEINKLLERIVQ